MLNNRFLCVVATLLMSCAGYALRAQNAEVRPAEAEVAEADTLRENATTKSYTITLPDYFPEIHGTFRGRFEYQTEEGEGRFQVRTARLSATGTIIPELAYKLEIDLCDEGSIKMLDAYARYQSQKIPFTATIGQMRVPFTIDSHRSPHNQFFANRSFIAKYGGNVRDAGVAASYTIKGAMPLTIEGGMFSGSGLTDQKHYWTNSFNFSAKLTWKPTKTTAIVASCQRSRPEDVSIMMWDAGAWYDDGTWHIEGEYLRKNYCHVDFAGVNIIDAFVVRRFPLHIPKVPTIAALARYDYMGDHTAGALNDQGQLEIEQPERHRLTIGSTLTIGGPKVYAELRLNYEKYFYNSDAEIPVSGSDKIVVELMCRF